ncbi:MAG: CsbD family protein [Verrucomicrobia bacterium]|nr:CsbD family protein [Verrucomicrobiota bacterium]MCH8528900.1 CsbD family protein [Kiritimatiellia bacterium]
MAIQTDTIKGRIKEAFGSLTGNKKLKAKGKTDQAVGKVKHDAEKATDKVTEKMRE